MTSLIKLTAKAAKSEIDGRKGEVLSTLQKLGASKKEVELADVKKAMKKLPQKTLRQHVRDLSEDKLITIKRVKAEKAAA